jgi:hypothetical protein
MKRQGMVVSNENGQKGAKLLDIVVTTLVAVKQRMRGKRRIVSNPIAIVNNSIKILHRQ